MPAEVLIVADDVSGAADCAVPFAVRGFRTDVLLDAENQSSDAEVLAIDARTRQQSTGQAAAETERIFTAHGAASWCLKKVDSTLRGHVGAEVAAALRARRGVHRHCAAIVAPAFPAMGRTTIHGHQYLHGVPLEQTELWARDRVNDDANVARVLESAGLTTRFITIEDIRLGAANIGNLLRAAVQHRDAVVCDAKTEDDLQAISRAAATLGPAMLWVGTAGLSHHMVGAIGIAPDAPPLTEPAPRGSILFVVGSPSTVSREQVAALAAEPGVDVFEDADPTKMVAQLLAGRDVVALPANTAAAAVVASAADSAAGLVLTGGETARAVLGAMGVQSLRLVDEIERGVPRGFSYNGRLRSIVLKAGAFGDRQTLVRCRNVLRSLAGRSAE